MGQYQPTISETMEKNVAVILNSEVKDCMGTGIKIKEYPEYSNYNIECVFKGETSAGEPFEITPLEINRFVIEQNFVGSYMDHFEINITLRPLEYLTLYDGYQNLACDVTLRYVDPTTGFVKGIDTEGDPVKQYLGYRVIFKNKQDILKKIPKRTLVPQEDDDITIEQQDFLLTDLSFQLIDDTAYKLRVKSFSFQLTESTVKDALLFIAHSCGIDTVSLVEPDNKVIIQNIIVPPIHTFDTALMYIQEIYGVYNCDIGYYYTDQVLYMYPKHMAVPVVPTCNKVDIPTFYYVGGSKYPNLSVNHAVDIYNTTHIVINAGSVIEDNVDSGIENHGTGILMSHADRMIDAWRSMSEAHSAATARIGLGKMNVHKTPNTELFALTKCERKRIGIDPSISIIKYIFDEGNPYKCRVPINIYKKSSIKTAWENAVPETFKPGYRIVWNYDDEDTSSRDQEDTAADTLKYTTKSGTIESVAYILTPASKLNNKYIFKCVAPLELILEMDTTTPDDSMGSSSDISEAMGNLEMGGGSTHKLAMGRGSTGCPRQDAYNRLKAKDPSQLTEPEANTLAMLEAQLEAKRQRLINSGSIY